jgi:hypothetical protein
MIVRTVCSDSEVSSAMPRSDRPSACNCRTVTMALRRVRFMRFYGPALFLAALVKEIMTHGLITASLGDDLTHFDALNDAPSRAPHACASQRQVGWHYQHRRRG